MTTLLQTGLALRPLAPTDTPRLLRGMALDETPPRALEQILMEEPCLGVVVTAPDGRIIAALGAVRRGFLASGARRHLGVLRAAFVDEAYRIGGGHGLLSAMVHEFEERFVGPDRALAAIVGRFHERDVWWLRAHRGYLPVASSLVFSGTCGPVDVAARMPTTDSVGAMKASMERTVIADDQALATQLRSAGTQGALVSEGGSPTGWIQWRHEVGGVRVLDLAFTPSCDVARLLGVAARGRGLRYTVWAPPPSLLERLQVAGLGVSGPEGLIAGRAAVPGLDTTSVAEVLTFNEALVGEASLPPLSNSEAISTPPPPGTHWDHEQRRRR